MSYRHALHLLKSPIGRDLSLLTATGVEFKVHPVIVVGGTKYLEEQLFPERASLSNGIDVLSVKVLINNTGITLAMAFFDHLV